MLTVNPADLVERLARKVIDALAPKRVVIGLSGGADSTLVLLIAAKIRELKPDAYILAVHCIHGLDADDPVWLDHCTRLCARLNIPLVTPKLNIVYKSRRSPEEVSRSERYKALLDHLKGGILMLGHQADDQVENLLLALKRGSGPKGLSGMSFILKDERGIIVRPLLELRKREIVRIIEQLGFDHVYDVSNGYLKFERNFIRLKVLPLLRERFAGIDGAIARSAKLCAQEHDLAMRYAKIVLKSCLEQDRINLDKLDLEDEALCGAVLRLFFEDVVTMPPDFAKISEILKICRTDNDQAGCVVLEGNMEVRRYRNYLFKVKKRLVPKSGTVLIKCDQPLKLGDYVYVLSRCDDASQGFSLEKGEAVLDFSYHGQLKLHPKNRRHSRELKKLMGEYGIPPWERATQCLVRAQSGGEILALGNIFAVKDSDKGAGRYCLSIKAVD